MKINQILIKSTLKLSKF